MGTQMLGASGTGRDLPHDFQAVPAGVGLPLPLHFLLVIQAVTA